MFRFFERGQCVRVSGLYDFLMFRSQKSGTYAQKPPDKPSSVRWRLTATTPTAIYLSSGISLEPPAELFRGVQPALQAGKVYRSANYLDAVCALTAQFHPCPHRLRDRWRFAFCCTARDLRPVGVTDYRCCCLLGLSSRLAASGCLGCF